MQEIRKKKTKAGQQMVASSVAGVRLPPRKIESVVIHKLVRCSNIDVEMQHNTEVGASWKG
jgi:hypothetical protein